MRIFLIALLAAISYAQTANVPFRLLGRHVWCEDPRGAMGVEYSDGGEENLAGFMAWHKELTDTEDPQTCGNYVAADPQCSNYYVMGSLYSYCMCVRVNVQCNWMEEQIDFEDHGIDVRIYMVNPPRTPALKMPHVEAESSYDYLTLGLIGFGGILTGMLTYFACSMMFRKCASHKEESDVKMDRLI